MKVRISLDCQTQAPFAEKLGITQTTLSKYENGTGDIPDGLKIKISEFGISIHWLVTGEGDCLSLPFRRNSIKKLPGLRGQKCRYFVKKHSAGWGYTGNPSKIFMDISTFLI
jgi:transcriptional regulator with XRE-family HTH domain